MSKLVDIEKAKIDEQKKFYKNNGKSICKSCSNYDKNCFQTTKYCAQDSKTGLSTVESCGSFNKDIDIAFTRGNTLSVENKADTRIESMGGGFQNVEKYKDE